MSENFFEKLKKYGILIAWIAVISVIVYFVKPDELYWRKDILDNEKFVNNSNIYIAIAIALSLFAIFKIYKTIEKEYKDNPKEKIDFIFYSTIISIILIAFFTFKINSIFTDSRLLINKQFEKGVVFEKYRILSISEDYLDIYDKSKRESEFINIKDSIKYKNIQLKDSIAVVKSKIGFFKIPYNHEIVEIK